MSLVFDGEGMAKGGTCYLTWPNGDGTREVGYTYGSVISDADLEHAPKSVLAQVEAVKKAGYATEHKVAKTARKKEE